MLAALPAKILKSLDCFGMPFPFAVGMLCVRFPEPCKDKDGAVPAGGNPAAPAHGFGKFPGECAVLEIGRTEAGEAHGLGHLRCAGEIVLLCEVEAQELRPRAVHGRRR